MEVKDLSEESYGTLVGVEPTEANGLFVANDPLVGLIIGRKLSIVGVNSDDMPILVEDPSVLDKYLIPDQTMPGKRFIADNVHCSLERLGSTDRVLLAGRAVGSILEIVTENQKT